MKKNVTIAGIAAVRLNFDMLNFEKLDFEKFGGIVPAIIQDAATGAVLMLGFMDREALGKTIASGRVTFWSRSKRRLWEKGEVSGNTLDVVSVATDCDNDTLLISARPRGPTCHTGKYSCFGAIVRGRCASEGGGLGFLQELYDLIAARKKELPKKSYTVSLFRAGLPKILKKIAEESGEVLQAARKESKVRLIEEGADLLYHLFVLLVQKKISLDDVVRELERRKK